MLWPQWLLWMRQLDCRHLGRDAWHAKQRNIHSYRCHERTACDKGLKLSRLFEATLAKHVCVHMSVEICTTEMGKKAAATNCTIHWFIDTLTLRLKGKGGGDGGVWWKCGYFFAKEIFIEWVGVILNPWRESRAVADWASLSNSTKAMSWRPGTNRTSLKPGNWLKSIDSIISFVSSGRLVKNKI